MSRVMAQVTCYGKWRCCDGGEYMYEGPSVTKGFIIKRGVTYNALVREIMRRFDGLRCNAEDVRLHHRFLGNNLLFPCDIIDSRDVDDLFDTYFDTGAAPIYVTVDQSASGNDTVGRMSPMPTTMDLGQSSQSQLNLALEDATPQYPIDSQIQVNVCADIPLCVEGANDHAGVEFDHVEFGNPESEDEVHDGDDDDDDDGGNDGDGVEADTQTPEIPVYVLPPGVTPSNMRQDGTGLAVKFSIFPSRMHFDEVVIDDALKTGDVYVSDRCNDKVRHWKCVNRNTCQWEARAAKMSRCDMWEVTRYNGFHTCDLTGRSTDHKNCKSWYIAWRMRDRFADVVNAPSTEKIMDYCHTELKQDITFYKAWDAHKKGVMFICGDPVQNYGDIPAFLHKIKEANPGTMTALKVDGEGKFLYCFLALGASIVGWTFMRRVIVIDAAFLKSEFKGQLVAAHAVDSEGHIFPIACGVINVECNKSWGWFLKRLKKIVDDANDLVIVSDRHNAIKNAVAEVYPNARHANCFHHLKMNLLGIYGNAKWEGIFTKAAYTCSVKTFQDTLQALKAQYPNESAKNKKTIYKYLTEEVNVERWARVCCGHTTRYEIMTSNPAESFNAAMLRARYVLPLNLLMHYVDKLIVWHERH